MRVVPLFPFNRHQDSSRVISNQLSTSVTAKIVHHPTDRMAALRWSNTIYLIAVLFRINHDAVRDALFLRFHRPSPRSTNEIASMNQRERILTR